MKLILLDILLWMLIVDLNSKTDQTNSWKKNLFRAINYKAQEILDGRKKSMLLFIPCSYNFSYTAFIITYINRKN